MPDVLYAELSAGDTHIHLNSMGDDTPCIYVVEEGVSGYWSTPNSKWDLTERGGGDGAFPIEDAAILYASRTVTVEWLAVADDRDGVKAFINDLLKLAHQTAKLRIVDSEEDTYATGYLTVDVDDEWYDTYATGTVTLVCADPRRYSTTARTYSLSPITDSGDGLIFDDNGCIMWPVQFGGDGVVSNAATLENNGTSTAYTTVTVNGSMPNGMRLKVGDGELAYTNPLYWQPLVLDALSGTATINGVDVTRNVTSRDFPTVPAGGTQGVALLTGGNCTVEITVRDTYV